MNKPFLTLLLSVLFLGSCQMARFDRVPGSYMDMMPAEIQGTYHYNGKDFRSHRTDTLDIHISPSMIRITNPGDERVWNIHQDFQIHRLNHLFVIARNDETVHSLWNLLIVEAKENGIRLYPVTDLKEPSSNELVLNRYSSFMDVILNHEPIQQVPNAVDGSVSVPTVQGNVPDNARYYQISDEQLFNYFEKELKDKEFVFLKSAAKPVAPKEKGKQNNKKNK